MPMTFPPTAFDAAQKMLQALTMELELEKAHLPVLMWHAQSLKQYYEREVVRRMQHPIPATTQHFS